MNILAQLSEDIAQHNVAHAYLFAGPPHLGKFSVARLFARDLLTHGLSADAAMARNDAIERLIDPDLLVLDQLWIADKQENWDVISQTSNAPQEHRAKKKVRTDMISIDDIRALQDRLSVTAQSSVLCCLIRSIERLQDAAANAFLKLLEEPPSRVVFILTAEHLQELLPTIVSRTRVLLFKPLSHKELAPLVANISDDDATFVTHLSQGAPGRIVTLLKNPDLLREEKQLHAQARRFWDLKAPHERLQWFRPWMEKGKDLDPLLLHLGLTLRELLPDGRQEALEAYNDFVANSRTNAHRGLLLERFALAVDG